MLAMVKRKSKRARRSWKPSPGADMGPEIRRNVLVAAPDARPEPGKVARAPTVIPAAWRDPEDVDANRREPRVIRGVRAADPLLVMHNRGGLVTKQHLAASQRLVDAYEVGVLGGQAGRGRQFGEPVGSGRQTAYPQEQQLAAMATFRAAMRCLSGMQVHLVGHVVLGLPDPDRRDVAAFAAQRGVDEKIVRGQLVAALDALVLFFYPPGREAIERAIDDLVG